MIIIPSCIGLLSIDRAWKSHKGRMSDNSIMQKLIKRNGFKECGTIYLLNGSPRMAFQWSRQLDRR